MNYQVRTQASAMEIPIPPMMRDLDRDKRGYPIPYIVLRDIDGKPHFTINDHYKVADALQRRACAICGKPWRDGPNPGMWLVGGPKSAFHRYGAYIDTPVHHDCGTYALMVCPYLAAPSYAKRIEDKTVDPSKLPAHMMFVDNTMDPERPEAFVFGKTGSFELVGRGYVNPRKPWIKYEVWDRGRKFDDAEAKAFGDTYRAQLGEDAAW